MERTFGRYRLVERVGRGGMGEVWRARMTGPGGFVREVAVKIILPHLSSEPSFRDLFSREARLAALLHHPNIVSVLDYGREEETEFIVMEFVRGTDLRALLRRLPRGTPMGLGEGVQILHRVARGLAHAHSMTVPGEAPGGIIHRDVSPHNILVSREGEVKVADFGIARAAGGEATGTSLAGKPSYASPEQVGGGPLDARSDLFSLGTVAYQILSGIHPFQRENAPGTLKAVAEADPPPLSELRPDLPRALAALVMRLLEKDPARRPPGAEAVSSGMESFLEPAAERALAARVSVLLPQGTAADRTPAGGGAPSPTAPTLETPRSLWSRLVPAAAVLAAAGLSAWLLLAPEGESPPPSASSPTSEAALSAAGPAADNARPVHPGAATGGIPAKVVPEAAPKEGIVPLSAIPWAEVWHQGERIGVTPLPDLALPPGRRTLILRNPVLGVERRIVLEVAEGRNPPLVVDLGRGAD